jgi:hypothetical protein
MVLKAIITGTNIKIMTFQLSLPERLIEAKTFVVSVIQ